MSPPCRSLLGIVPFAAMLGVAVLTTALSGCDDATFAPDQLITANIDVGRVNPANVSLSSAEGESTRTGADPSTFGIRSAPARAWALGMGTGRDLWMSQRTRIQGHQ